MIRKDIKALAAYHVPDSSGMIKLDAMENPHILPESMQDELAERLKSVSINRYPDADMQALRAKIAKREGLNADQVLLGNGSDEIIQMILMAADQGACITPSPTFVMYDLISRWVKRPMATVPLKKDFSLDAKTFLQIAGREKATVAFLACPNNPTGNMWPESTIKNIIETFRGLIVIDEAYLPFAKRTHTSLIAPNVVVLRTFSKLGWAGLRLGYLLGDRKTIEALNKVRMPYNIDSLTQISADYLLDHADVFEQQTQDICKERSRVSTALMTLPDVTLFPSQANFVLIRVKDADAIFEALKEKNILIKNMNPQGDLLANCLRITIGTQEENDTLLSTLKEIII
ncbi:MAG: histidinol-phosphate transaminase [Mariprofundaceae bacterium]